MNVIILSGVAWHMLHTCKLYLQNVLFSYLVHLLRHSTILTLVNARNK